MRPCEDSHEGVLTSKLFFLFIVPEAVLLTAQDGSVVRYCLAAPLLKSRIAKHVMGADEGYFHFGFLICRFHCF